MNWHQSDLRCPICEAKLWVRRDYLDTVEMENAEECRNRKNYQTHYTTGSYEMLIGGELFGWAYNTPDEEYQRIKAEIDGKIDLLKISIDKQEEMR